MAELMPPTDDSVAAATAATAAPAATQATEVVLRARIAELEALLDARTQTIVGLGARVAEMQGGAPPASTERIRTLEAELAALRATKVIRYSAVPRRWYTRIRGRG